MPIASARWRARGFETPAPFAPYRVCASRPFLDRCTSSDCRRAAVLGRVTAVRIFVTGGTGFIGGEVVRQLRARGDEVTCLVRDPEKGAALAGLGCTLL